jgi:hypothetical protein
MKPETLITALKTALENDAVLSTYIEEVLVGRRTIETITSFPSLWIELAEDDESDTVYSKFENILSVNIVGIVRDASAEVQILGDASNKGILAVLNDVKKAIDDSNLLTGIASMMKIGKTTFSDDAPPMMAFAMQLNIHYSQSEHTRL